MSIRYPWYDSPWLECYVEAREIIRRARPDVLPEFIRTMDAFRTRPDFAVTTFESVFDSEVMRRLELLVQELSTTDLEMHELKSFGRFIIHDHPWITELQSLLVGIVSEAAGEAVEPCYNFLSLYTDLGVCPVHMDAPEAKWTLDLCIRQSRVWPIRVSQVVPWPEDFSDDGADWVRAIIDSPTNRFKDYCLEPGRAILFSGSSQWHYRDALPGGRTGDYCDLAFFHFVPSGTADVCKPDNWARVFDVPELKDILKYSSD